MANLSSKTGTVTTPVQAQISLANNATTSVQDMSAYQAQEVTGFVYIDATADLRCSFKVQVVKNGADVFEIAAVDLAGDDYSGAPLLSFSMSGSILQATLPNISGFVSAYLRYQLSAPYLGGNYPLTISAATTSITGGIILKAPTQTRYTSGSGTYTVPSGVLYLKVRMVGGGGGGGGSYISSGTLPGVGAAGTATTFGSSLLTANGGAGGAGPGSVAAGGTATISSPAYGVAITGQSGGGQQFNGVAGVYMPGGAGGSSPYFGGGAPTSWAAANGLNAVTNTGGGGSGGGSNATISTQNYGGGGSGGFIEATIPASLAASYSYSVGAAGAGGAAGNGGYAGGSGAAGIIIIDEYYY